MTDTLSHARELSGQVAFVTGATRNIGRAIAEELAAAGAHVAVAGHSGADAAAEIVSGIEGRGGRAIAVLGDVRNPQDVGTMVGRTRAAIGGISILVNCAAVREETPFSDIALADWQRILGIVLDGAFNLSQAVLPDMRARGSGTIINIGGETGHTGARERAHVVTAKAGIAGFTKALALDLAAEAITVNCVVPGAMNTPDSSMKRHAATAFQAKRLPPVGRRGEPWEIAAMVRMLCGPGGRYVTGQSIHVNGGFSCH
jgi:3-oxoacyl-[acyl-carrier protein] reductase